MFEAYWLNVGSLILGCIALGLPIIIFIFHKKVRFIIKSMSSMFSMSCCASSLCMQIFYANHLVNIGDWTALMDTSRAISLISLILLIVTIILNLILLAYTLARKFDTNEAT